MYAGARLAPIFRTEPVRKAAERMARRGGERVTDLTVLHTPVDTGHLKTSWKTKPVLIVADFEGNVVFESGVETDVDYAPDVEYGTGLFGPEHAKYPILPKKPGGWLHWVNAEGKDVFARKVMHPGSPGAHMVAIAIAETEAGLDELMLPELERWKLEQEALMEEEARRGRLDMARAL